MVHLRLQESVHELQCRVRDLRFIYNGDDEPMFWFGRKVESSSGNSSACPGSVSSLKSA